MHESLLYIQKIRALYETGNFSKSDYQIADYILSHPSCVQDFTASELASASGTSSATVIRFCRKLGFNGLPDMKMSVKYSGCDSLTEMAELTRDDSVRDIRRKVIQFTKTVLDQLNETLDDAALLAAAKLISSARQIVITGEGGSGTICRAAYDIFLKLTIPCQLVMDPIFETMVIDMMQKDDVLLVIASSGRPVNTVTNVQFAHEKGIPVIGIVGPANSPISKYLTIEIQTNIFNSDYFSDLSAARTCELTTISILHSIIALSFSEERLNNGREVAKSMERKRIPFKKQATSD